MKHTNPRGFTLVELLVVIGIIALLISILLPALSRARLMARRTQDLSNIRQVAIACVTYATESRGYWPLGHRNSSDLTNTNDDLVWINGNTFAYLLSVMMNRSVSDDWSRSVNPQVLQPAQKRSLCCTSMWDGDSSRLPYVGETPGDHPVTVSSPPPGTLGWTYLGFTYWPRRANVLQGQIFAQNGLQAVPTQYYQFPIQQTTRASSQVLLSCPAYAGPTFGSALPHYSTKESYVMFGNVSSPNDPLTMPMQGLCFAYTDGSARWVARKSLWSMNQGSEWIYFDKTRP